MKLKCPLCMGFSFDSEEALLHRLLSLAATKIACPVCTEVLDGCDKFTIHLCSHVFSFQSNEAINLVDHSKVSVVSLNEKMENIRLEEPTNSSDSIDAFKVSRSNIAALQKSIFSDPSIPNENNFSSFGVEPKSTNSFQNLQFCGIPPFCTNSKMADSRATATKDELNSNGNDLPVYQVLGPRDSTLALQVVSDCNISAEPPPSHLYELSQTEASLPVDILENLDFLLDSNQVTEDFVQPMNLKDCLPKSLAEENIVSSCRPLGSSGPENECSDPIGENVNQNLDKAFCPPAHIRCDICSVALPDVNILSLHKELVHENSVQSWQPKFHCEHCKRKFKLKASLLVHQQVAHFKENGTDSLKANQNGECFQFRCKMCPKVFKKENYLIQHMKTHEEKQWACDECGKIFATKHFLQNHKRLHTGEMPYICSICNKQFTFQQSYHRHIAYHNSEKPHRCKECGKSFKELSTLYNHQRIHTGEKPFACDICGKSFRQRVTCLMHSRIHSNTKEYKCNKCQKLFRYKISLRSHKCVHSANALIGIFNNAENSTHGRAHHSE